MPEIQKGEYKLADFKREPPYERRVVVFYDFLGWQSHIDRAGKDPKELGFLRRMLLRHPPMLGVKEDLEIRYSTFSDNVVITQEVGRKTQMFIQQLARNRHGRAGAIPRQHPWPWILPDPTARRQTTSRPGRD